MTATDDPILYALYDGLLTYTPDSFEPTPQLATSYEVGPDNLSIVFKLREGIKFHDGEPFNAAAMVTNFDRFQDEANGLATRMSALAGGKWEAPDPTTFKLTLAAPYSPLLARLMLRGGRPISPKAIAALGNDLTREPVGTGPFKFGSRTVGSEVTLKRNEDYWQSDLPHVDEVRWRLFPDVATLYSAMRTGEMDITGRIPFESVAGEKDLKIETFAGTSNAHLSFDTLHPPFNDVRLRRAVSLAIDREAINDAILFGLGAPMDQPITSQSWAYDASQPKYKTDLEEARKLVQEAAGGNLEFRALGYTSVRPMLEAMQVQLREAGITMNIETGDEGTIIGKVVEGLNGPADGAGMQVVCTTFDLTADPDQYFTNESFGLSEAYLKGLGVQPRHGFPEVGDLIGQATKTFDIAERKSLYKQILTIVNEQVLNVGIVTFPGMVVTQQNVQNARAWVDAKYHLVDIGLA